MSRASEGTSDQNQYADMPPVMTKGPQNKVGTTHKQNLPHRARRKAGHPVIPLMTGLMVRHPHPRGYNPICGYTGMCRSTESGTHRVYKSACLSGTGYTFCPFRLWNMVGFCFPAVRIALQTNIVAVTHGSCPAACWLKHAISDSKVNCVSNSGTGYLFSPKLRLFSLTAAHPHSKF